MATEHIHRYLMTTPAMDRGVNPLMLRDGIHSESVGVDGRFRGGLKPFPGFRRAKDLNEITSLDGDVKYFRYFVIQKRAVVGEELRGFLVWHGSHLSLFYWDTEEGSWDEYEITDNLTGNQIIDKETMGRYLYVVIQGEHPSVFWWSDSDNELVSAPMGPLDLPDPPGEESRSDSGGHLRDGLYQIAYRYYNSEREVEGRLSEALEVTLDGGTEEQLITISLDETFDGNNYSDYFDKVQVFRTVRIQDAPTDFAGGVFYLEGTYDIAGTVDVGMMDRFTIVQQEYFNPEEDREGDPPESGAIASYLGTTFMAAEEGPGFVWSKITEFSPEMFNPDHRYRAPSDDGSVMRFIEAGGFLYALSRSAIYRIRKEGTMVLVDRLHQGRGLQSSDGVTPVGEDLIYTTPSGIGVLHGAQAHFQLFSSMERILLDEWLGEQTSLICCSDTRLGATFVVAPNRKESLVIWHTGGVVTKLEDMYFVGGTEGPAIKEGSDIRAYFITEDGLVVFPDHEKTGTKTMLEVEGTVNGEAESGTTTTLKDTAASFDDSCVGARLHIVSGDLKGESTKITARISDTEIEFDALPAAVKEDDRYVISPIIFRVKMAPIPTSDMGDPAFDRRKVSMIGVRAVNTSGTNISQNPNAFWEVGVYTEMDSTPDLRRGIIQITGGTSYQFVRVSVDGIIVEPFVKMYAAGVDFELTGVEIRGTIGVGRQKGTG